MYYGTTFTVEGGVLSWERREEVLGFRGGGGDAPFVDIGPR